MACTSSGKTKWNALLYLSIHSIGLLIKLQVEQTVQQVKENSVITLNCLPRPQASLS